MGFFQKIISSLSKMSIPIFLFDEHNVQLSFKLKNDNRYLYNLEPYEIKTRHDSYVIHAYTLKTSSIYLEYINLDSFSSWNGLSRGFYEKLLTDRLKVKLELVERIEIDNYEFSTYKVDEQFILHLIFIWEVNKDIFILDTKGKLYKELLSSLKDGYIYKFDDEEKGSVNFDISLVKENSIKQFFNASGG